MKNSELKIRIPYADVDQMGVVYYANYFVYFERGRTELLRESGCDYLNIEKNYKLYLPVMEAGIKYLTSAKYDDQITVKTTVEELNKASVKFRYEIFSQNGKKLADGFTLHPCVNEKWKPTRLPDAISNILS